MSDGNPSLNHKTKMFWTFFYHVCSLVQHVQGTLSSSSTDMCCVKSRVVFKVSKQSDHKTDSNYSQASWGERSSGALLAFRIKLCLYLFATKKKNIGILRNTVTTCSHLDLMQKISFDACAPLSTRRIYLSQ